MSADPRGTEAKAKASNAWSEGKYDKAVEYFSEAITFGGDNELLKVLHSNRSAAYLKLNKMEESLKDANKCVDLDSKWGKGYTRKGDALLANKKFSEAYNAYNSALQFAPSDLMLTKKCEQAMRGIRNSTSPSPSGSSAPTTMPTGFVYFLKVLVLVLCATYILPLGRTVSVTCYKTAAGMFAVLNVFGIYRKFGFPQLTSTYGSRVIHDPLTFGVFLGLFNLMSKPYMLALLPIFLTEVTAFTSQLLQTAKDSLPAMQARLQPVINQYMPSMAGQDLSRAMGSLSTGQFNFQLLKMAATCEVYQGLFLIVELALPTRNVMQLYLWWQYLQMRYMMDPNGNIKEAFADVDNKISGLLAHRLCPGMVRQGYGAVKGFMAGQVKRGESPAAASEAPTSGFMRNLGSKCCVM